MTLLLFQLAILITYCLPNYAFEEGIMIVP